MTLPLIQATGDPFAVGFALGRQARTAIHEVLPRVAEFRDLGERRGGARLKILETAIRDCYPRYFRELEGLAAGADFDLAHLLAWNCRGEFRFAEGATTLEAAGCTTVLSPARDGRPAIVGHNEDGEPELHGHCFLVDVTQEEGPAFTSFCYPGLLPGHTFAVTGHGLVQTINNIQPHDLRDDLPRQIVTRAVLDCPDLDQALAVIARHDRASGFHHGLAQAGDPRVFGVEAPPEGCYAKEITGPYVHANHMIEAPFAESAQTTTPSSTRRQARGEELLMSGVRNGDDARHVLFDSADDELPIYRRCADGPDSGFTHATAIFEIHEDRVAWQVYHDADEPPGHEGTVAVS